MKEILLAKKLSPVLENLFSFFINSGLNGDSTTEEFINKAKEFVSETTIGFDNICDPDLYLFDLYLYLFSEEFTVKQKILFVMNFSFFHSMVKNIVQEEPIIDIEKIVWTGLKRQVSPPYQAYKFQGHTNLDIDFNSSSNYYLFDKD